MAYHIEDSIRFEKIKLKYVQVDCNHSMIRTCKLHTLCKEILTIH